MYSEYYEEIDLSNDDRKRACINALRDITSSALVSMLLEAVRVSHINDNIRKEDFWADLFISTNNQKSILETPRQGYPNRCPADAYSKLDSQAWLKYLLYGNNRVKNRVNVSDSKAFFKYFKISFKQENNGRFSITDEAYKDALKASITYRNSLFAHENPAEFSAVTFEKIAKCCQNLRTLLLPLCKKQWSHQLQSIQVYNKISTDLYNALGDTEYTIPNLMLNAGIPASDIDDVKDLFCEVGLPVNGEKVTFSGDPTVFVDALSRVWLTKYSVEGKASLLKAQLPAYEEEIVHTLVRGTYGMDQLSDSALEELVDSGSPEAQHEKAKRLLKNLGDDWEENHKNARLLFKAAAEAGLPESQSQIAQYLLRDNDPANMEEVKELLASAMEHQDPHSYFVLGEAYLLGRGVEKDEKKAYEMFCRGAEMGDGPAKADKARCELYGIGTEKNELALATLKMLAKNEATAASYLGFYYYNSKNYVSAIETCEPAAKQGLRAAQYLLGRCYYYGDGVEENDAEAVKWFAKAAAQEHSTAQSLLGECYYYGNGVEKDHTKAVEWFTKAVLQGHSGAQYMLGKCYYFGNGVEEDYTKAVELFTKADLQGHSDAQYMLGNCYYHGNGVEKDHTKAVDLFTKADLQGHRGAQYMLGKCYYYGDGVESDYTKAVDLFTKAALKGHIGAQYMLGNCYYFGHGTKKNYIKAVDLFTKAIDQDHLEAQSMLGKCYYFGNGVEKDYTKAVEWFTKAHKSGDSEATLGLGVCYYDGNGVENDDIKAYTFFMEAAKAKSMRACYMLGLCYYHGRGVIRNYIEAANWLKKAVESYKPAAKVLVDIYSDENKLYDLNSAIKYCELAKSGYMKVANMFVKQLEGVEYDKNNPKYLNAMFWLNKAKMHGHDEAELIIHKLESKLKGDHLYGNQNIFEALKKASSNSTASEQPKSKIRVVFPED